MSEDQEGIIPSAEISIKKTPQNPIAAESLVNRVNQLQTESNTRINDTSEIETPIKSENRLNFESFLNLDVALEQVTDILKSPQLEELREKDEILAKNWTDEIINDLEPACKRAIAGHRKYATAMQFADASLAVPPEKGPLLDFHQFEDDEYAAKYFSVLGAKAKDSAEKGFLLDAGGEVIQAILRDKQFPRVTQEDYRSEKVTYQDFIVTKPDGEVSSVVVSTRMPDVQLVLNGVFPEGSRHYLVSPSLRIKMQPNEENTNVDNNNVSNESDVPTAPQITTT